jgi:Flp pilus assembly protein TadD
LNKNLSQNQINTLLKYYNDKQLDEAEKYGFELSKEFPEDPFIWKALGVILKENNKTSESISANQKSLKINPNDAEVYNNLGFIYEEKNYHDAEIN